MNLSEIDFPSRCAFLQSYLKNKIGYFSKSTNPQEEVVKERELCIKELESNTFEILACVLKNNYTSRLFDELRVFINV